MWIKKSEGADSVEAHTEYINVIIEALRFEGANFIKQDANAFKIYYKRYLERFSKAVELVRACNNIEQELYPIKDPRLLIAQTITHFCMTDDETLEFIAEFGLTTLKQVARVREQNTIKADADYTKRYL